MDSLGQLLKSQRESKGLTLEEVRDATRITLDNLVALEADRFDRFPNKVYARAFLRDYSNYLGLDSPELLVRFDHEWVTRPEPEPERTSRSSAFDVIGYFVLAAIIAGGLCAAGYFIYVSAEQRAQVARPVEIGDGATLPRPEPAPEPEPQPRVAAEPESAVTPPTEPEPEPAPKPTLPDKLVLEVTTLREVWIGVIADGARAFWNTLPGGQTKTFEAKRSIRMKAGMAGAVSVKLNGVAWGPLAPPKSVGNKTFTLKDVAPPKGDQAPQPASDSSP
jgi:hypothetical protein